jgi:hypothetical protein
MVALTGWGFIENNKIFSFLLIKFYLKCEIVKLNFVVVNAFLSAIQNFAK